MWDYGLYALGFLTGGFLGIATLAVVLMYVKRGDTAGTMMYASHFDWLLRNLVGLAVAGHQRHRHVDFHRLDRRGGSGGCGCCIA